MENHVVFLIDTVLPESLNDCVQDVISFKASIVGSVENLLLHLSHAMDASNAGSEAMLTWSWRFFQSSYVAHESHEHTRRFLMINPETLAEFQNVVSKESFRHRVTAENSSPALMGIKSALYKVLDYPWPERGTRHALHTTRTLPVHQLRKPSVLSSDIHGGSTSILGGLGKNTQARVGPSKPKSDDFRQHVVVYSAYPVSGAQLGAFVYGEDFATDQNNLDILAGEDTTVSDAGVTSHAMLRTEALGKVTSTGTATTTIGGDVPTTTSGTDTLGNVVNTTATTTANKVDKACAELYGSLNKTSAPIARFETRGIRLGMVDTSCLPRQECGTEGRSDTAHCSEVAGNAQAQGGGSTSNGLDIGDNGDAGNDHELVRDRDSPAQHGSAPMVNRCRRIHGNSSSSAYAGARAMDALAVSLNGWFLTLHATCCLSRALNVHDATLAAAYCPPLTHLHSDHTHVLGSGIATDTHPAVGGDAGDTLDALPRRISIPIPAARLKQYRSRHADTARGEGLAAAQAQPIQSAQLHTRVHTVQTTGVHTHIQMGGDGAKGHAHTGDMENTVRDMTVNMVSITTAETSPVVAMAINADAHGTVSSLPVQIGRSESEPTEAACDSNTILIKTESIPANGQMLAELTVNPILTATDSTGGGPLYAEATIDPNTAEAELDNIPIDRAIPTEPALRLKVGKMVGSPIEVMIPTERALDSTAGNTDSTLIDEVVPAQHVSGSTAATTETTLIDGQIPTELEQGLESVAADTSSTRVGETLPTEKLLDSTTAKAASVSFDRTIPTEQVQALEPVANDANSTSAEEIIPTEEVLNSMAAKTVSISMDGKVVTEGAKNSTATDANTSVRRIALGVMTEPWYTGPSIARTHNAGTGDSLPNIHAHEKMALVNITNSMTHSGSSTDKQAEHTDDEAVVSTAYTPTYTHKHTHDNAMDGIAKTDSMGEPSGAMDRQQVHQQRFDYVQSLRQMLHLANTKAQRDSEKGPLLAAETKAASKDKEKRSSSARLKDTADNDEGLAILELTLGKLRDDYAVKKSVSHAVKSAFNTYTTYLAKSLAPKQIKARVKSVVKRRLIQTHDSMNTKVSEMFKTTGVDAEVNGIAFRSQQIRVCQVQVAIRFQLSFMEQPKKDDPKSKRIRETLKYIQTISLLTGGGEPFNDYILNDLTKTHAETFPLTTAYLNSELDLEDMETTANEIRSGLPRNATAGTSTNNLVHTAVSHVSSGTEDLFSGRDNLFIARENTLPHASTDATTGGVGESGTRLVSNCSFGIGNSNADNFDIGNPNQADINSKMAMRRTLTNNSSRRTVVMNHRNSLRSTDSQSNLALYQRNTSERRAKRLSQRPAVVSRHSNNQNQSLLSIGQSFLSNTRWEQGTPCDGGESSATDDLQLHSKEKVNSRPGSPTKNLSAIFGDIKTTPYVTEQTPIVMSSSRNHSRHNHFGDSHGVLTASSPTLIKYGSGDKGSALVIASILETPQCDIPQTAVKPYISGISSRANKMLETITHNITPSPNFVPETPASRLRKALNTKSTGATIQCAPGNSDNSINSIRQAGRRKTPQNGSKSNLFGDIAPAARISSLVTSMQMNKESLPATQSGLNINPYTGKRNKSSKQAHRLPTAPAKRVPAPSTNKISPADFGAGRKFVPETHKPSFPPATSYATLSGDNTRNTGNPNTHINGNSANSDVLKKEANQDTRGNSSGISRVARSRRSRADRQSKSGMGSKMNLSAILEIGVENESGTDSGSANGPDSEAEGLDGYEGQVDTSVRSVPKKGQTTERAGADNKAERTRDIERTVDAGGPALHSGTGDIESDTDSIDEDTTVPSGRRSEVGVARPVKSAKRRSDTRTRAKMGKMCSDTVAMCARGEGSNAIVTKAKRANAQARSSGIESKSLRSTARCGRAEATGAGTTAESTKVNVRSTTTKAQSTRSKARSTHSESESTNAVAKRANAKARYSIAEKEATQTHRNESTRKRPLRPSEGLQLKTGLPEGYLKARKRRDTIQDQTAAQPKEASGTHHSTSRKRGRAGRDELAVQDDDRGGYAYARDGGGVSESICQAVVVRERLLACVVHSRHVGAAFHRTGCERGLRRRPVIRTFRRVGLPTVYGKVAKAFTRRRNSKARAIQRVSVREYQGKAQERTVDEVVIIIEDSESGSEADGEELEYGVDDRITDPAGDQTYQHLHSGAEKAHEAHYIVGVGTALEGGVVQSDVERTKDDTGIHMETHQEDSRMVKEPCRVKNIGPTEHQTWLISSDTGPQGGPEPVATPEDIPRGGHGDESDDEDMPMGVPIDDVANMQSNSPQPPALTSLSPEGVVSLPSGPGRTVDAHSGDGTDGAGTGVDVQEIAETRGEGVHIPDTGIKTSRESVGSSKRQRRSPSTATNSSRPKSTEPVSKRTRHSATKSAEVERKDINSSVEVGNEEETGGRINTDLQDKLQESGSKSESGSGDTRCGADLEFGRRTCPAGVRVSASKTKGVKRVSISGATDENWDGNDESGSTCGSPVDGLGASLTPYEQKLSRSSTSGTARTRSCTLSPTKEGSGLVLTPHMEANSEQGVEVGLSTESYPSSARKGTRRIKLQEETRSGRIGTCVSSDQAYPSPHSGRKERSQNAEHLGRVGKKHTAKDKYGPKETQSGRPRGDGFDGPKGTHDIEASHRSHEKGHTGRQDGVPQVHASRVSPLSRADEGKSRGHGSDWKRRRTNT